MARRQVREEVLNLPVFDTHTHLETSAQVAAVDFFDIAHYFWFRRELEAAGYPRNAEELEAPRRLEAFTKAYARSRNTSWAHMVRRMVLDLYDVDIREDGGPRRADEAIRERSTEDSWPSEVCERIGLRTVVTGLSEPNDLARLGDRVHVVPVYRRNLAEVLPRIKAASNQRAASRAAADEIESVVNEYAASGYRTIRIEYPFAGLGSAVFEQREPDSLGSSDETIRNYLGHRLMGALAKHRMHVQVFLGMKQPDPAYESQSGLSRATSLDDAKRVVEMHEVFDMYAGIDFELVNAAPASALDIVQAARIYPNVYPGGLWWFNFRASTYRANMQYRLEALPAVRSTLVASDARHIEWAYAKILFVKLLLAEFLQGQIAGGWIDTDIARFVAASWLHDAASQLYRKEK